VTHRLPPLPVDEIDETASQVFDLLSGDGRNASPLYLTLARAPAMLESWAVISRSIRADVHIPARLRELMIMRIAQLTGTEYAWAYHWKPARDSGISTEQLDALSGWGTSPLFDASEKAVLTYTEAVTRLDVDVDVFRRLESVFRADEIVELTVIAAFYCMVGRVIQALGIEVDDRHAQFLPAIRST